MEWLFVACYVWAGVTTVVCFSILNRLSVMLAETLPASSRVNLVPPSGFIHYAGIFLGWVTVPFTVIYLFYLKGHQSGSPDPK